MSDIASIKGSAFEGVVEDLRKLMAEDRLDRDELEAALEAEDLAHFDAKVQAAFWYPMGSYVRMVEILARKEDGGDRAGYLVQRGVRAAERLAASGLYRQLEATSETWGHRVGKIMVSMAGAIYNFTHWRFEFDPDARGFIVEIRDAAEFPEIARYTAQGFIQAVADRTTPEPMTVDSERPAPDLVVIRGRALGR